MLTPVTEVAILIKEVRMQAGLSVRGLAQRAGVAYSTVSRIEAGQVDPTTGMLTRLLDAAGQRLELTATRLPGPELADLADAWRATAQGERPDWTRLRAFLDQLAQHPEQTDVATLRIPDPSGSAMLDNVLAAVAEKLCDDAGRPRPFWTRRVAKLTSRWSIPGTPRMREAIRSATPAQFEARGLTIDEASLWRERVIVGV